MNAERLYVVLTLSSLALLFYTYAAYPGLLWLLSKLVHSKVECGGEPPEWPKVSVVLSAFNEAPVIATRMKNLLKMDYPRDRLEFLVGSDGSTDQTCEIIRRFENQGITLAAFPQRRGKASVVNDLVSRARGDIVVLTDANAFFRPQAVRELVRALWRLPSASAVVGHLELISSRSDSTPEGAYWRYETWLKTLESHFGSVLGANGAIYAFLRERYQALPATAIVDDFLVPTLIRLRTGGNVYFVRAAQAYETTPSGLKHEFRRRVRIGAGDVQALIWTWRLLLPSNGMAAFVYFSHKVLRWLGPWLLLTAFLASVGLLGSRHFRWLFYVQVGFYGLATIAGPVGRVPLLGSAARSVRHFTRLNIALMLGFLRFALGLQRPFWTPVREHDSRGSR